MFKEKPTTLGINPDKTTVENTEEKARIELNKLRSEYEQKAKFSQRLWSLRESSESIAGLLNTPESEAVRDQFLDYQQKKKSKWPHGSMNIISKPLKCLTQDIRVQYMSSQTCQVLIELNKLFWILQKSLHESNLVPRTLIRRA